MRYKITCFLLGCASVAVLFCIAIVAHSHGFHINREIDIFGMLEALATIVSLVSIWIVIFQFHAEHEKKQMRKDC